MAVIQWLLGRSDSAAARRRQEIAEVSLKAAEDSKKFALAGEQRIVNDHLTKELGEVRRTLNGVDAKLDTVLLGGRIQIKRDDGG